MRDELGRVRDLLVEAIRIIDERATVLPLPVHDFEEIAERLCDPSGGGWIHQIADGRFSPIRFFRDGRVNDPDGGAIWSISGRELLLKWPSDWAPGGFWIDRLAISDDGTMFEGVNQQGVGVMVYKSRVDSVAFDESEFVELCGLLESDSWPQATFSFQIADESSEADKRDRAEGIASILLPPMRGKRFLDFGCGEGHVARFVSDETAVSVGYDIEKSGSFVWGSESDGHILTTDFSVAAAMGPFDVVLAYDVLDHSEESMSDLLALASSLMAEDGVMVLRCHPWTSRHGGHLYRRLNKAFAHLVLSDDEAQRMGLDRPSIKRQLFPLDSYLSAIKSVGLKVTRGPEADRQEVEPFFLENPLVRRRILRSLGVKSLGDIFPNDQMSVCFVDYWLKKK